ncbi:hypothetical protein H5407_00365 [Mitsuaria sp. WAJ17]|uniref:hypothetical protein n=1 Tax=Mitsuaria sp. WAJ17 TaxID=2761452 RepID=UPI001601576F|nr:hypothetical protein [Mitsuaria sp. WAJ17]MBB2483671.1 hypothetical protein [Mitsuaria sp. WAJ17]
MQIRGSAEPVQRNRPASAEHDRQPALAPAGAPDDSRGALQLAIDRSPRIVAQRRALEGLCGRVSAHEAIQLPSSTATAAQRSHAAQSNGTVQRVVIGDYDTDEEEAFKLALEEMGRKGDISRLRHYHDELRKLIDAVDFSVVDYQDARPFRLLSVAKLALAKLEPPLDAAPPNQQIYLLPKSEWWRLFIDARYHQERNPLKFDYQQSPGFFSAMMAAFEEVFGAPPVKPAQRSSFAAFMGSIAEGFSSIISAGPEEVTPELYQHYHDLVRRKVLTQPGGSPRFATIDFGWSNTSTTFGANGVGEPEPDTEALAELINEGIAYVENPHLFPDALPPRQPGAFVAIKIMFDDDTGARLYECACKYDSKQAPVLVERILATYYAEVGKANKKPKLVMTAIVRLIRNLHVGHFFTDANGRINIMLLLNKFLMENNLPPVILRVNPGVFGGLLSIRKLVDAVEVGIDNFRRAVKHLQSGAVVGSAFDLDDVEQTGTSGLILGLGGLGPSTSGTGREKAPSLGLGPGLGSMEGSSRSTDRPRTPIVDVFIPFGTPFAVNDPSIRSLGECFWDTFRQHGLTEEELGDAAKQAGLTVDQHVFLDTAGAFIDAINEIKGTTYRLRVDQFDIKTGDGLKQSELGSGGGPLIPIGFAVDRDTGQGHFIPPYRR